MNKNNINSEIEEYYKRNNKETSLLDEYEKKNKIGIKKGSKKISHMNFTTNNKKKLGIKDNLLQWPSTEQLNKFIINKLKQWSKKLNNKKLNSNKVKKDIEDLFNSDIHAVEKIDGSNFGIDSDGRLFGRRTELGYSFKTFKGCDIEKLRDYDTKGIQNELSSYLHTFNNNDNTIENVRLYGELSCYPELYKYKKRGLDCVWHCFGIILKVSSREKEWEKILLSKGFAVSRNSKVLQILSNPIFYKLLDKFNIPHLKIKYSGKLKDLIINKEKWMKKHSAEGFVLTVYNKVTDNIHLLKWKQSQEEQSSSINLLKQLLSLYNNSSNSSVNNSLKKSLLNIKDLLSPELIKIFKILLEVAVHHSNKSNSLKTNNSIIPDDILNEAIKSAETKYNDLNDFINRNLRSKKKKLTILEIVKLYSVLIKREVLKDIIVSEDKQKKNYIEKKILDYVFQKVINIINKKLKKSNKTSNSKHLQLLIDEAIKFLNINIKDTTTKLLIKKQAVIFIDSLSKLSKSNNKTKHNNKIKSK